MKRYMTILFLLFLAAGCCRAPEPKDALARVNNYEITKEEFNDEFKASRVSKSDSPGAKKEFLENLINRKLILQDAQAKKLDRDANFLKSIQRFWEQSLLKLAIEKKVNETAASPSMSEREAKEAEERLLNDWIAALRKKANISVNYNMLEKNQ
jgi:PBP1b-binding outer membrane lipoprotein LpoB